MTAKSAQPNGFIFYRGPSMLDGSPISKPMNTYDVWTPLARDVPRLRVRSPDSFTARKDFAAMHPGMEVTDVCASRVFVPQAPSQGPGE